MNNAQRQRRSDPRVPRARKLRRDVTFAERKLWWHLKRLSLGESHFRRQTPIGPFFADFACHEKRLVVEIDGGQHNEPDRSEADARRDAYLKANGYRVLRFWNNDVMANVEGVLAVIAESLEFASPPTPDPSPPLASLAGGGE